MVEGYTPRLYGEISSATALYELIEELLDAYKANLEKINAKASGELVNAATFTANRWDLRWKGESLSLVLRLPDYWTFIEEGRGPTKQGNGNQLYEAILEWIEVKHIVPHPDPKTGIVPSVKQLAYMITRKIHKYGYFGKDSHGKFPLHKAIEETNIASRLATALTDQFNQAIKVEIADNLTNFRRKPAQ